MRLQLALNVRDLKEAVEYYSKLFAVKPHKPREGYANFADAASGQPAELASIKIA